jgi:alpha-tubulin suppressor-like RCC1 family protein
MPQPRFFPWGLQSDSGAKVTANRRFLWPILSIVCATLFCTAAYAQGPTPGQNVNMVSGITWPDGDPFLQRQDEPAIALSTRNACHLLAGANDYRTVDYNFLATGETGDAWLGLFKSFDCGASWQSTLLPGYPADGTPEGANSPLKLQHWQAASDPVVRSGPNGFFGYSGIAFTRATNPAQLPTGSVVFFSRFVDLNNKENGSAATGAQHTNRDAIRYIDTSIVATGSATQFLDKPWMAIDVARFGAPGCTLHVPGPDGVTVTQSVAAGNIYVAFTAFNSTATSSQILFSRSTDCGATWSKPINLTATDDLFDRDQDSLNQGPTIAIDPQTGFVYVAWRRFATREHGNAIVAAASINGGQWFTPGIPVITLPPFDPNHPPTGPNGPFSFFDQGTSTTLFRTSAFPSLAVEDSGRRGIPGQIYLAWSQRGVGPNGEARIMMVASPTTLTWPRPFAIANGPLADDDNDTFSSGHQLMPQLTFIGGKLVAVYYDQRLDHTLGFYTPNTPFEPDPSHGGRLYQEDREPQGELATNPGAVFTPNIDDGRLTQWRHTLDVMLTQAVPGPVPVFTPPVRVSQYIFGLRGDVSNPTQLQQLQEDPPNLPMFAGGTEPFFGDYIDVAGLMMVPTPTGGWIFNTAANPNQTPVFYAAWTTNQDVRPPKDGNWKNYLPLGGGGKSILDGSTTPACLPGQEGMRNQNIYSSQITEGLVVSSPQTFKPLGTTLQRTFIVLVQNLTNLDKTFHLTIANQPPGGFASFVAGINNQGSPVTPPSPVITGLDVDIPPHSGIARSVFATSTSTIASITVNVVETTPAPGTNSGLTGFVVFNPDPSSPLNLIQPDGVTSGDVTTVEIYTPSLTDPTLFDPNAPNPNAPNPNPKTGLSNPNAPNPNAPNPNAPNPNAPNPNAPNPNAPNPGLANPNAPNPNAPNPNAPNSVIANPNAPNPNAPNPNAPNPNAPNTDITNASIFDGIYTVTNTGNTTASYQVKLVGSNPGNIPLQLAVNKTYQTPTSTTYQDPMQQTGCQLTTENHNNVQAFINNPPIFAPTNLNNSGIQDPSAGNTTFALLPGESALVDLRGYFASYTDSVAAFSAFKSLITQVTPVVVPHAANTNDPSNTPVATLVIPPATLPNGAGTFYSASVQAIGGKPPYQSWSVTAGTLPGGLSLNLDIESGRGLISGTPTTAGTFTFTVQVTDSAANTATRQLSITIVAPQPPTNLRRVGSFSGPQVTLAWDPSASGVVGYNVYRATTSGGYTTPLGSVSAAASSFVDNTVLGGNTYYYVVTAVTPGNIESAHSNELAVVVTNPVPNALTFIVQPSNTVAGIIISPPAQVQAADAGGTALPNVPITLSIGSNPGGGTLSGTIMQTTGATGIATFSDLKIDKAGSGYSLVASALSGTVTGESTGFSITNSPIRVAAGAAHTCALLSGGTVECWGSNSNGQLGNGTTNPSSTPVAVTGLNGATAIAAGFANTCALLSDGTMQCWGSNISGQLGNGTTSDSSTPVSVNGLTGAKAIVAGIGHICALLTNGTVECWGFNSNGQLGNGTTTASSTPMAVSGLTGVTAIAAGGDDTCALLSNGTVKCWGLNFSGQLGNGTTIDSTTPVAVGGLSGAAAISAGYTHTCAVLSQGTIQCWGSNSHGQLGNGTTTDSSTPVAVSGLTGVTAIAAGGDTAVGHTCALLSGGTVECWGFNSNGQLGNGTTTDSSTPVAVSGLTGGTAIADGGETTVGHTCALLSGGTVKCWGSNVVGQLGNGTTTDSSTPVAVIGLSGLGGATTVAGGGDHTCALLTNGTVKCWGYNSDGQLGNGTTIDSTTPVAVSGLSGATAMVAGNIHTCALLSSGTVQCWGGDSNGQLGSGTTINSSTPVAVSGLSGATAIASGASHTCALLSDGTVQCWGYNGFGQLGNGTTTDSSTPVAVSGLSGAKAIVAGAFHTCALLSDGTMQCWGYNGFGQLGSGMAINSGTPVAVSGLSGATAIAAGGAHTCALLSGGTVECWGEDTNGQLGNGTTATASLTPVTVSGLSGAKAIAAGSGIGHTCALLSSGTVQCWGYNAFGQLGNGTTTDSSTPLAASGLSGAKAIAAGAVHTCTLPSNGTVQCWGYNAFGQLGNGTTTNSSTPVAVIGLVP